MQEDSRPKVVMTKNELTRLLNLETLNRRNTKAKQYETMLDLICHYFVQTKTCNVVVDLPE
jgi:hypothetical protein